MAFPPVVATLVADTRGFNAKIDESAGKMEALGKTGDSIGSKLSSGLNKAATGIIVAGVAVAGVSIKMASDFQTATTELVTGAGESAKNIEMVRQGILALAPAVGQSPIDLAKGMYLIESAGFHAAQGLSVLKAAAEGAKVGGADMATVADALTTALHDYKIPASEATGVTSALVATVAAGKTHMENLAASLGRVLPVASSLNIPLQNVLGSVAALTNTGMTARLATTNLSQAMLNLVSPSSKANTILGDFGLTAQGLLNTMRDPSKGISVAFQTVIDAVGKKFPAGSADYIAAIKAMTGTTAGLKVALDLTGTASKTVIDNTKSIGLAMANGKTQVQGWGDVTKELSFQLDSLKSAGSSAAINLGNWLLPKATDLVKWVNHAVGFLREHPLVTRIASDTAIGLFAASVGFKLAKGISSVIGTFKSLFGTTETAALAGATTDLFAAVTANSAATEANTIALGGEAAGIGAAAGAGGLAAGGAEGALAGGAASKLGVQGLTMAKGVGVAVAGVVAYQITSALLHTKVGATVGNAVVNYGGGYNVLHDLTIGIANLTGAIVHQTATLSPSASTWSTSQAGLAYQYNYDKTHGISTGIHQTTQTKAGHKVTVWVNG